MGKFDLRTLLTLITIIGPRIKEALPLIMQLIGMFKDLVPAPSGVSYVPAECSDEYRAVVEAGIENGADPEQMHQFVQVVEENIK